MNIMKKNGGFTLVELIVVIAILAILAGVAVPAYTGYIEKANEATDLTKLDGIKTAVVFAVTEDKLDAADVNTITVTESDITYVNGAAAAVSIATDADFLKYAGLTSWNFDFNSSATKAEWTEAGAKWTLTK